MKNNDSMVIAVGLIVILVIAALTVYGNNEFALQSTKANNAMSALLLQKKDFEIKKLVKRLNMAQTELGSAKATLESVKNQIDSVKKDLGNITGKAPAK